MPTTRVEVNQQGHHEGTIENEKPSLDEWVLAVLREHGTQTLDNLAMLLRPVNWGRLFLAVDRLSRSGKVALWSPGFGEYFITAKQE